MNGLAGAANGGTIGSLIPGIGTVAGAGLGGLMGAITGLGKYEVRENSLMGLGNQAGIDGSMGPPIVSNSRNGVRIKHREYIKDIVSSTAFSLENFFLNPGLHATFPWLSRIAQNFEQYKFHGIIFEFRSTSADALDSTNTALGTVIQGTDYNPAMANFSNKQQMENNEWSVSTKPSNSCIHPIECSAKESQVKLWFVRTGPIPVGSDQRLYDLANYQIATSGSQAQATIGELWCSYDCEFFKPVLDVGTPEGGFGASFTLSDCSATALFGTDILRQQVTNNCNLQVAAGDGVNSFGQIEWPAGNPELSVWSVSVSYQSNGSPTAAFSVLPTSSDFTSSVNVDTTSLTNLNIPQGNSAGVGASGTAPVAQIRADATWFIIMGDPRIPCLLSIDGPGNTFVLPGTTNTTTGILRISRMPNDFLDWNNFEEEKKLAPGLLAPVHPKPKKGVSLDDLIITSEPDDGEDGQLMVDVPGLAAKKPKAVPQTSAMRSSSVSTSGMVHPSLVPPKSFLSRK